MPARTPKTVRIWQESHHKQPGTELQADRTADQGTRRTPALQARK